MVSELIVLNVLNYSGDTSPEYFNIYLEISTSEDAFLKIKDI